MSNDLSTRLTAEALRLGDSPDLPPELLLSLRKLEYTDADPVNGGSGTVRFGICKILGKMEKVAIKEFYVRNTSKIKPLFSREAYTWRELSKTDSHFIVKFFGADISDSRLRLVSRRMEHGNIVQFLNVEINMGEAIRCQTIYGVVCAIERLHAKGYIHADIKGANILVDEKGNPKLGDFGISCLALDAVEEANTKLETDDSAALTQQRIVGSIRWMAPERFNSPFHEPTRASDVYSFAYLVCEIFNNRVPFAGTDDNCVFAAHLSNSIMASTGNPRLNLMRPASLTSDDLWGIIVRCMKNAPGSRPKMEDLKKEIKIICKRFRPVSATT
ncbi:kinase-like domain-containing protein [Mycena latifolia]|nr:kinase-like domain-containing protein [Mycena latifolia]